MEWKGSVEKYNDEPWNLGEKYKIKNENENEVEDKKYKNAFFR